MVRIHYICYCFAHLNIQTAAASMCSAVSLSLIIISPRAPLGGVGVGR